MDEIRTTFDVFTTMSMENTAFLTFTNLLDRWTVVSDVGLLAAFLFRLAWRWGSRFFWNFGISFPKNLAFHL